VSRGARKKGRITVPPASSRWRANFTVAPQVAARPSTSHHSLERTLAPCLSCTSYASSATARVNSVVPSEWFSTVPRYRPSVEVQPGEVGLAFIYFGPDSALPPADAEYEFTVNTSASNQDFYNTAPLKGTEASASGDAIVGAAVNATGKSVEGPFSVSIYCFDGDTLLSQHGAFAEQDGPAASDAQVTFTVPLYGASCPIFTVGVGGYFAQ
jgi:hypothetical protein